MSADGCIKAVDLDTRRDIYIRVSKIAAFRAIRQDGPTRVLFDAGGHVDICGAAAQWRLVARIIELGENDPEESSAPQSEENAA